VTPSEQVTLAEQVTLSELVTLAERVALAEQVALDEQQSQATSPQPVAAADCGPSDSTAPAEYLDLDAAARSEHTPYDRESSLGRSLAEATAALTAPRHHPTDSRRPTAQAPAAAGPAANGRPVPDGDPGRPAGSRRRNGTGGRHNQDQPLRPRQRPDSEPD